MIEAKKTQKGKTSSDFKSDAKNGSINSIKLIMFDLDGTLAESKAPLSAEMADLLCQLMTKITVAVISGASFAQFQSQFLHFLHCKEGEKCGKGSYLKSSLDSPLANLLILPTVGASFYRYETTSEQGNGQNDKNSQNGQWKLVYEKKLTPEDVKLIRGALEKALALTVVASAGHAVVVPEHVYGERIEDRGTQVTFSALGQEAPISEKAIWDPDHKKRQEIVRNLAPLLPDFEIEIGGMTSIDITKKGMNKEHGITAAVEDLGISKEDVLYVGDSLFPGGNDYGAVQAGVRTLAVKDVSDTKKFIREYLAKPEN